MQAMAFRFFAVGEVWLDQLAPPLEVNRIVPLMPTAQHVLVLTHPMACSWLVVPDVWLDQLAPPLEVTRIVPLLPTAQQ